jgi:hypothetical protein
MKELRRERERVEKGTATEPVPARVSRVGQGVIAFYRGAVRSSRAHSPMADAATGQTDRSPEQRSEPAVPR